MLLLTSLATAGLALTWSGYALARRSPRVANIAIPMLLMLLVARAVLARFPAREWALFPWPAYALVQGFVLYALAAAFFGVAATRLPVQWNRVVVLLVAMGVLAHGLHRHRWIAFPEVHGDDRTVDESHHLQQSTSYTCGPAACASALSYCGVQVRERDMAAACLTRRQGTSLFDLYRGIVVSLHERPFRVSIEDLTVEELLRGDHLVVSSNAGLGHALCIRVHDGLVDVHDPLQREVQRWTRSDLARNYRMPAIVLRAADPGAAPR